VILRVGLAAAFVTAIGLVSPSGATADGSGDTSLVTLGPANPFMSTGGGAAVHNDAESSDASPQAGPGSGPVSTSLALSGTICPTILSGADGTLIGYCLDDPNTFRPSLRLLDSHSLTVLASYPLQPTGRYDVYLYLDQHNRVVLADGRGHILRVTHDRDVAGNWQMKVTDDWDVSAALRCAPSPTCDYVVSVLPDWTGRIWFSSTNGVIGTLDPDSGVVRSTVLPDRENVTKPISSSPEGIAVASEHALYFYHAAPDGAPQMLWREEYDRGSGVKPGQLTDGTGTAPTFFGPDGDRYVTIVDNAATQEHVLIYRVNSAADKRLVCSVPVFTPGASATDNTSIGVGRSVVVSNTYGYNFQDPMTPTQVPGGLTRVTVRPDETGCDITWTNPVSVATAPKLSVSDGLVYTIDRKVSGSTASYALAAIDSQSGRTVATHWLGSGPAYETLQLPGVMAATGTYYQSTIAGILRLAPSDAAIEYSGR
jgi:hypothetical protein